MSINTSIGTIELGDADGFGEMYGAVGVEETSRRLHNAALAILERAGKSTAYTADEYVTAVGIAQRKLGVPDVHTAMAGRAAYV